MRRPFALRAEIGGGFHEARAEELLPETVHRDARGERMVGADQPAREIEPIGRVRSAPTAAAPPARRVAPVRRA